MLLSLRQVGRFCLLQVASVMSPSWDHVNEKGFVTSLGISIHAPSISLGAEARKVPHLCFLSCHLRNQPPSLLTIGSFWFSSFSFDPADVMGWGGSRHDLT